MGVEQLLRLPERGWKYYPYGGRLYLGGVIYTHDLGSAGKSAHERASTRLMTNTVIGHTHCLGIQYKRRADGETVFGASLGWGGDLKYTDYAKLADVDWHQGFGIAYIQGGKTRLDVIPVRGGSCWIEGDRLSV